jgi:hypothetical protein
MKTRDSDSSFPADIAVYFLPLIVALPALALTRVVFDCGWIWVSAYVFGFLLVVIGAAQMFRAKLPFYRKRLFFECGTKGMSERSRGLYISSLKFIGLGSTICGVLVLTRLLAHP